MSNILDTLHDSGRSRKFVSEGKKTKYIIFSHMKNMINFYEIHKFHDKKSKLLI